MESDDSKRKSTPKTLYAYRIKSATNSKYWRWINRKLRELLFSLLLIGSILTFCYLATLSFAGSTTTVLLPIQPLLSCNQKGSPIPLNSTDFGETVNFKITFSNWNLEYKMNRPKKDVCAGNITTLVIVVSKPDNFYARERIRQTWMYDESNPPGYHSLFIIGGRKHPQLNDRIKLEQNTYGDIIRYQANDTYENLHVKTHAAFNWQQTFCPNAKYLLKTDDDTVVYLKRLDHFIQKEFEPVRKKQPLTLFCNKWTKTKPIRDKWSHYYVPESTFPDKYYPTFCQGCSYLSTTAAITHLLNKTQNVPVLHLEDVLYTGLVVKNATEVKHYAAGAFGVKQRRTCDQDGVPYKSVYIEIPSWKLDWDFHKLKTLQCPRFG
ncbi:Hexosyltransferase [Aphelenchoides bicaudatus]|nr:Hexosyltransferase [Aphelenchoides bicaudatus]